jgi:hypothetical protein
MLVGLPALSVEELIVYLMEVLLDLWCAQQKRQSSSDDNGYERLVLCREYAIGPWFERRDLILTLFAVRRNRTEPPPEREPAR